MRFLPVFQKRKSNYSKASVASKIREERQRKRTKEVAHKLYQNRLLIGQPGNAQSDWETAEKIVKTPWRSTLFFWHRPFIKLEKSISEPLLKWANNQAWLSLLGVISNIGIIIAVVTYVGTEKQRRDSEVFNAWQTISSAYGQPGSGGRIEALEFLNASPGANWRRRSICLWLCTWPPESLEGVNLAPSQESNGEESQGEKEKNKSKSGVYLVGVQLPHASLSLANLEQADLRKANLQGAVLWAANLEAAALGEANLEGADLSNANLKKADPWRANLKGATLRKVNLEGADLLDANLEGANLSGANLEGAYLWETNLKGVQGLTQNQITRTKLCETKLPNNISLDPNRDCQELKKHWPPFN